MKLIFVRHGQDDHRFRGGWSSLDLIPEGIEQAKALAKQLHNFDNISYIVSSDLPRCLTTASILSKELGIPIQKEEQIRETNNGLLAGMDNEIAKELYPGLYFSSLAMDEAYPNGESPSEFYERIKNWFVEYLASCKKSNKDVIIVTHGGVINIIYHLVKDIPWSNKNKGFVIDYCSMHILNVDTMEFE